MITQRLSRTRRIQSEGNVDAFSGARCRIRSGATVVDSMAWGSITIDDNPATTLALAGVVTTAGGPIELACRADSGADGVELAYGRIAAIRAGA